MAPAGATLPVAAEAGILPLAAAATPPVAMTFSKDRRSRDMSALLPVGGLFLLAFAAGQLLGRHPPRPHERSAHDASHASGYGADVTLLGVDRRVGVGGGGSIDVDRGVDRDAERDLLLGAPRARVPDADRPSFRLAETEEGAIRVGRRPLAAELVEAVALPVPLVAELLREAAGVEMGPARTVLVDRPPVRPLGPSLLVERGEGSESYELEDRPEQVVGIRRASGDRHHSLPLENHGCAGRPGRVRVRGGDSAPRYAGSDGDDRPCLVGDFRDEVDRRPARDLAVDPVVLGGDGALDDAYVLARVFRHRLLERVLGLVPGRCKERLVIVERDQVQDQLGNSGMRRPEKRLGTAGARLEVQPDHRGLQASRRGLCDPGGGARREADGCGRHGDDLDELAPVGAARRELVALHADWMAHGNFPLRTWVN